MSPVKWNAQKSQKQKQFDFFLEKSKKSKGHDRPGTVS
jgi:hypothetical protein